LPKEKSERYHGSLEEFISHLALRQKLVKCYIWSIALHGAEILILRAVDQKHLESFEMCCWRRMEKISWTEHVRNEEVLLKSQVAEKYPAWNKQTVD
jgi:vacuolar-type H+-ATPase subunit I/STV1